MEAPKFFDATRICFAGGPPANFAGGPPFASTGHRGKLGALTHKSEGSDFTMAPTCIAKFFNLEQDLIIN